MAAAALLAALLFLIPATSGAVVLKMATLSPDGSSWMKVMREGADQVKKETGGAVQIRWYPGGVMGDDDAVLRKIRIGQIHGGAFIAGSLAKYYPDCQIYGMPFSFDSLDEVDAVREKLDPVIIKGFDKGGFTAFGFAEGGFAYLMSQSPIRTLDDARNRKLWVPNNDTSTLEIIRTFGISPVPLSIADVRAGLQTGLIDAVSTSPIGAVALQWHTQVDYVLDLPLLYIYAVLGVEKKAFERVPEEHRETFRRIMAESFKKIDRLNREDNESALSVLKNRGVQFVRPSDADVAQWKKKALEVPEALIKSGRLSPGMVTDFNLILDEYRRRPAQ